jgi:glycerol-3-phosphate dehydrogenase (NAD(P)+)
MVAEGVDTVKAVYQLSRKYKVPMPITREVYQIIYQGKNPSQVVSDLLNRRIKAE